jgi:hypothetical protein
MNPAKLLTALKAIRAMIEVRNDIDQTPEQIFQTLHRLADEAICEAVTTPRSAGRPNR